MEKNVTLGEVLKEENVQIDKNIINDNDVVLVPNGILTEDDIEFVKSLRVDERR